MRKIKVTKLNNNENNNRDYRNSVKKEIIRSIRKVQTTNKIDKKDVVVVQSNDRNKRIKIVRESQPVVNSNKIKSILGANRNNNFTPDKKINEIKNIGIGRILVMIACGPSVNEIDVNQLNGLNKVDLMVINKPIISLQPKFWAFCDQSQYLRNKDVFNNYGEITINSNTVLARKNNQIIIQAKQGRGVIKNINEGYIIGRSSVYANLQVALWMNYEKIFIFGVDMCSVNGKLHHYGVNPDVPEEKRIERFKFEAEHYDRMAELLQDNIRKKIYFCSSYNKWGFVDKFNKLDHKKAIEEIKNCIL